MTEAREVRKPLARESLPPTGPRIMASLLTADFSALGDECRALEEAGVDGFHWDVMDGIAVPALSFGPDVIAACRRYVRLPFEAHIMSRMPERLIAGLAAGGCDLVIVHPDWLENPRRTLQLIVDNGMSAGVALAPGTPVDHARWYVDIVDLILVMTVEPGFGGQRFIPLMAEKVRAVAAMVAECGRNIPVEVDGGIAAETIGEVSRAGAARFVVGSAFWRAASFAEAVCELRERAGTDPLGGRNRPDQ